MRTIDVLQTPQYWYVNQNKPGDSRVIIKSVLGLTENVYDIRYISRGYGAWQSVAVQASDMLRIR